MDRTKDVIRSQMRHRRAALGSQDVMRAGCAVTDYVRGFAPYGAADAVLLYVATDNEVPTADLIAAALAEQKRVFLPRVDGERMAFIEIEAANDLRPGRFGIPEPTGTRVFEASTFSKGIAFVPLTAWDRQGGRLGRGRGFYDRALSDCSASLCLVGLAYAFQEATALPTNGHDARLDHVITERAVVRCGAGDSSDPDRKEDEAIHGLNLDDTGQYSRRSRAGVRD